MDRSSIDLILAKWNTGRPAMSSLKSPLFLALTVSPLLLLLPNQLDAKNTGVEKMFQAWHYVFQLLQLNNVSFSIG
jgi:hypothetical protein